MDSYGFLEIIGFMDSINFFEKKCIRTPVFFMYSDFEVQKLKGFEFGEISTSASHVAASNQIETFRYKICDGCDRLSKGFSI